MSSRVVDERRRVELELARLLTAARRRGPLMHDVVVRKRELERELERLRRLERWQATERGRG